MRQGEATVFVRLSGCSLKCNFCDTKYAWKDGSDFTVSQIVEKVRRIARGFPARWVCLTGGEPLTQDLRELVNTLKKENFLVQVETNGRAYRRSLSVDWWTVSPKPGTYSCAPEFRAKARELKLIVTGTLSLETIRKLRREFPPKTPIFLQPQSGTAWSRARAVKLIVQAIKEGLLNIRLTHQLHKIYNLR